MPFLITFRYYVFHISSLWCVEVESVLLPLTAASMWSARYHALVFDRRVVECLGVIRGCSIQSSISLVDAWCMGRFTRICLASSRVSWPGFPTTLSRVWYWFQKFLQQLECIPIDSAPTCSGVRSRTYCVVPRLRIITLCTTRRPMCLHTSLYCHPVLEMKWEDLAVCVVLLQARVFSRRLGNCVY